MTLATAAKPASSQVRRALWSGLTRTSVNVIPSTRARSLRALHSPRSVKGISVRPVCRPTATTQSRRGGPDKLGERFVHGVFLESVFRMATVAG